MLLTLLLYSLFNLFFNFQLQFDAIYKISMTKKIKTLIIYIFKLVIARAALSLIQLTDSFLFFSRYGMILDRHFT